MNQSRLVQHNVDRYLESPLTRVTAQVRFRENPLENAFTSFVFFFFFLSLRSSFLFSFSLSLFFSLRARTIAGVGPAHGGGQSKVVHSTPIVYTRVKQRHAGGEPSHPIGSHLRRFL